ncbi:MAG: phosphoribosylglycinamide formyltransferase [Phycisphaerales bacterium]|nr:phosphoribosylglycinamide formyltransferase [Phycisphaerales bacterium]
MAYPPPHASTVRSSGLRKPPFSAANPARLVVIISGAGRTLLNLHEATRDGRLPSARITGVISSSPPGSEGFERARALGGGGGGGAAVPVVHLPGHPTAAALEQLVMELGGDYIVLAGYLKRLEVPASLAGRIVNIHPALLPDFGGKGMYGRRVHEAVLASGVAVSGCTVHLVDSEYDHGPVLLRRTCPVLDGDTPETLAARVFQVEREAYVEAIGTLLAGRTVLEAAK